MGKKNKKKLHRMMRANAGASAKQQNIQDTNSSEEVINVSAPIKPELTEEDHEVKKEIRKILTTIGIMVLAIVAVYFINTKSDIILHAGQWMVGKLNLSI